MTLQSTLGHISREKHDLKDICTSVFTTALFTTAKTWKKPKCPLTEEWIKRCGAYIQGGCILSCCLFNLYAETSCEMPGWMKHKLESRLLGEKSITSDTQMTLALWQKVKRS